MAALTPTQLDKLRQLVARDRSPNWTKAQINAAAQAFEDWLEVNQASAVATMDAATSPLVLPGGVKTAIANIVFAERGKR